MTAQRKRRGRKPHQADAVVAAALSWWLGHRPMEWSESQHLATPAVNVASMNGKVLAHAVAELRAALTPSLGGMRGSDANPRQKTCFQCGMAFTHNPCGPTHATIAAHRAALKGTKT